MAMSSITVSGITPDLSILGQYQQFKYTDSSSSFRLFNDFVPLIGTPSQTLFEYRNHALLGFRWIHTTTSTDTIGQLKLQSFLTPGSAGTDILMFNNDGTITFGGEVRFPTTINVNGSSQTFAYSSIQAQPVSFIIKNNFEPILGQDSVTSLILSNADNYKYKFTQDTANGVGLGYGTLYFDVEEPGGAVKNVYSVVVTDTNTLFGFVNDCIITVPTPTQDYQAVNKIYVDLLQDETYYKEPCSCATTGNITATYDNGAIGVGATLTGSGVLIVDGQTVTLNQRVLVKNQTNDFENGIYELTTLDDPFVLTRTTDYDSPVKMSQNTLISVILGDVNNSTIWTQRVPVSSIGTDPITYSVFTNSSDIYLEKANNLSDVANVPTARANLGLTDIATQTTNEGAVLTGGFGNTVVNIDLPADPGNLFVAASGTPAWSSVKLLTYNSNFLLGISAGGYDFSLPDGDNTAIGIGVLENSNSTITGNTGVGFEVLRNNTDGSYCTGVGTRALFLNTIGFGNTAVGEGALDHNTEGYYNTALGTEAGNFGADNNLCIFIGHEAASTVDNLTNAIVIGAGATVSTDNTCNIGISGTNLIIGSGTGNITGLNAVTAGSWQGNTITVNYGGTGQTTLPVNSLLVGNGTSGINNISAGNSGTVLVGVTGDKPIFSSTPTVDTITILNSPTVNTDGVNKAYVDALTAGLTFVTGCYAATTANLSAIYLNGAAGVGATLTSLTAVGAFTVDDVVVPLNARVLVKDQTSLPENGVYILTTVGDGSTAWVLTRASDYDQSTDIIAGSLVPVKNGTINAISSWVQFDDVVTVGTDPIDFTPFTFGPMSYLQKLNNLSDLDNISIARTNLGLTDIATQTVTNNAVLLGATGNTINSITLTNGQILIGSTGNTPVGTLPTNGNNISWSGGTGTLTANITGQIALANGGTNANLTASAGGIVYSTASALAILPGASPSNRVLLSNGTNAPFWSQATFPNVVPVNQLLYAVNANEILGLNTNDNGVLITNSTGVPSIGSTLPTAVQSNITATGTVNSGTWQGNVVGVQYGGTGSTFYAPYGVVCGGSTTTSPLQSVGGGLFGYVLVWQSSGLPAWKSLSDANIAPKTATYIVQTPDSTLSNEQALSSLSTGLLKNTTGTGVLSIATAGTDYYVPGANLPQQTQFLGRCILSSITTSGIANSTWATVYFNGITQVYNPSSWWAGIGATSNRITPGATGLYRFTATVRFSNNTTGKTCGIMINFNGQTPYSDSRQAFFAKDGDGRRSATITLVYTLTSITDYVELLVYQDSGTTLNLILYNFMAEKID